MSDCKFRSKAAGNRRINRVGPTLKTRIIPRHSSGRRSPPRRRSPSPRRCNPTLVGEFRDSHGLIRLLLPLLFPLSRGHRGFPLDHPRFSLLVVFGHLDFLHVPRPSVGTYPVCTNTKRVLLAGANLVRARQAVQYPSSNRCCISRHTGGQIGPLALE